MNRSFLIVLIFLIVLFTVFFIRFKEMKNYNYQIMDFNSDFLIFNEEKINGLDIATVINKAVSNNEKYSVEKDKDGYYNLEDEYCIEIYITMPVDDSGNTKTFKMETFNKAGMGSFISSFGEAYFKCNGVTYNTNGKVRTMTFELIE